MDYHVFFFQIHKVKVHLSHIVSCRNPKIINQSCSFQNFIWILNTFWKSECLQNVRGKFASNFYWVFFSQISCFSWYWQKNLMGYWGKSGGGGGGWHKVEIGRCLIQYTLYLWSLSQLHTYKTSQWFFLYEQDIEGEVTFCLLLFLFAKKVWVRKKNWLQTKFRVDDRDDILIALPVGTW